MLIGAGKIEKLKGWLLDELYQKKLQSTTGFILLLVMSILTTFIITKTPSTFGLFIIGGLVGCLVLILAFVDSFFALTLAIIVSIVGNPIHKYLLRPIPFGVLVDVLIMINFIGCISMQLREKRWNTKTIMHPVTFVQIIFTLYMMLQFFNTNMHSHQGYFGVARRIPVFLAVYFIAIYNLNNIKFLKKFIVFWLVVALITAFYAFYQEFAGITNYELRYYNSNEKALKLVFIGGRFRKFSFFNDPTSFGIFMAISGLLFMVLSMGPFKTRIKIGLFISSLIMFIAMAFSGTRTAYAIVPIGIVIFALMTITHKRTLIIASFFTVVMAVILYGPFYGNRTINRIRSTFKFSEDASLNVRDVNRAFIQPYIYEHPFGGGVATSGVPGKIFNPNHYLAGFPPDSAYLQTAMELGWIGLFLMLLVAYVNMRTTIKGYYRSYDPKIKTYYLSFATVIFTIIVAQYAQYALSFTNRLFYMILLACIVKLIDFDKKPDSIEPQPSQ
ncbi:O-antigen ligase family protein (plasmid) [Flammeovirgaceae bacterium SG7u.111]|nr:O-antigen ligase family protein [Flammeovirgaceae bacterium SG7u.132]WPO38835.1 O-antigen ligase family protein [Flammeovirgaceae bacterium SG7u.111]